MREWGYKPMAVVLLALGAVWYFAGPNATDEHGMTALMRAARAGDTAEVQRCLRWGARVDAQVPTNFLKVIGSVMGGFQKIPERDPGWTALTYASAGGHLATVELLLRSGADANSRGWGGSTALLEAQEPAVVQVLLAAGAQTETQGLYEATAFWWATARDNREKMTLLMQAGANINAPDWNQLTPLHVAVKAGNREAVKLLLSAHAALEARDKQAGWTPLMWAVEEKHDEIAALLKQAGARDESAGVRLIDAVVRRDLDGVKRALSDGAPPDARSRSGDTPLQLAANLGDVPLARVLIAAGARLAQHDSTRRSPLYTASSKGDLEMVRLLLDSGAAQQSKEGGALAAAALGGHREVVEMLLAAGIPASGGALREAARQGYCDLVQRLLQAGASASEVNVSGMTALFYAAGRGQVECVRLLLAAGADPNKGDIDLGRTPLAFAAALGHAEVVRLLIEHRADVNLRYDDETPLQLAAKGKHAEVARLLREAGAQ